MRGVLLLLISSLSAQAACRVGLIDTDTTRRVADSPCIVDQSVWVVEGVTLPDQRFRSFHAFDGEHS